MFGNRIDHEYIPFYINVCTVVWMTVAYLSSQNYSPVYYILLILTIVLPKDTQLLRQSWPVPFLPFRHVPNTIAIQFRFAKVL